MSVAFGERRGWIEGLPGLDWACVVLTAFVVADVHFVLASVAREAKRHVIVMVGLGSDWVGLGVVFLCISQVNAETWVARHSKTACNVTLGSDWGRVGVGLGWNALHYNKKTHTCMELPRTHQKEFA